MSRLYFILILLPCTLALIRPPKKNTLRDDEINKLVAEIGKLDKNFPGSYKNSRKTFSDRFFS